MYLNITLRRDIRHSLLHHSRQLQKEGPFGLGTMGSDNPFYAPPQGGRGKCALSAHRLSVELGTHIQEKEFGFHRTSGGFTCEHCPQPVLWVHTASNTRLWRPREVKHEEWAFLQVAPPEPIERCRECNNRRARHGTVRRNLVYLAARDGLESLKFITLTRKTRTRKSDYNETEDLAWFKAQVTKLTRRVAWKKCIQGAHVFYEVKESKGKLHTHAHLVASGKYWHQRDLEKEWGGRCDIQAVKSLEDLTRYLGGYLTKSEPLDGERCRETFGSHRGIPRQRKELKMRLKEEFAEYEKNEDMFSRWDWMVFLAEHQDYQYFWMKMKAGSRRT